MNEIYLIRHGETEWNSTGRFQGKLDSPLTEKGIEQAMAIGRQLAKIGVEIDAFYASPLGRTRQTTSIIATCGQFPETRWDERLAEVSVGSWDGLTHVDIDAQWPGRLDGSTPFDWYFRSPDGESYDAAVERTMEWLADLHGAIIAVSHGLIGRIIRGSYLGLSKDDAMVLPVPHDVIWRLSNGQVQAVSVG